MKSEFNEFTYAYAVTEDVIRHLTTALTAAPFIPTLFNEGQAGGGYDIKLSLPGYAVFYQYKISDALGKRGKLWKDFERDYFRFKIWKTTKSDQQDLMMTLENAGEQVSYVAPAFATNTDLNFHYTGQTTAAYSIFVKPSAIGALPDNKDHYWAFDGQGRQFFCSTPIEKTAKTDLSSWLSELPKPNGDQSLEQNLATSLENLRSVALKADNSSLFPRLISNMPVAVQVETLARTLGLGTVVVGAQPDVAT